MSMSIGEAIAYLEKIRAKYGADISVYFDCPKCKESFSPTVISTQAVHIRGTAATS